LGFNQLKGRLICKMLIIVQFLGAIMITRFETRYFYIVSPNDEKFIKWNTVKGILNEDITDDYEIISDLMAQDVRDKFGEEYEVCDITKDEFEQRIKPNLFLITIL
jgi:hypothetical protein